VPNIKGTGGNPKKIRGSYKARDGLVTKNNADRIRRVIKGVEKASKTEVRVRQEKKLLRVHVRWMGGGDLTKRRAKNA